MARSISIIGCGAVGRTLARALASAGYEIAGLSGRRVESARAAMEFAGAGRVLEDPAEAARAGDIVFITVPDFAIRDVCATLADGEALREGQTVLHCSGALGSDALAPAAEKGASVGALHPMQTFANPTDAVESLPGTVYTFEGDGKAFAVAEAIVAVLKGRLYAIDASAKALYHAAASIASNYLVALEQIASDVLAGAGLPKAEALAALMPIIRGTVNNLDRSGLPNALTGPISRGDVGTVQGHLDALRAFDPHLVPLYASLGLRTLDIARAKGAIAEDDAQRLHAVLSETASASVEPRRGGRQ